MLEPQIFVQAVVQEARPFVGIADANSVVVGEMHTAAEALRDRLESSPLIGWLKDLDGRYVYVNRGYLEQLDAAAERVLGHLDAELAPREAVDGPRLQDGATLADEPLQLEYRVAAFEGRPALAVLRFPVRDDDGTPICVCGVAAPVEHAQRAREECTELMGLEGGIAGGQRTAELAQERRRVAALHEASASAAKRAHELAVELTEAREQRDDLERQLTAERARREQLDAEIARTRAEAGGTDADRARLAELAASIERERARATELAAALEQARARTLELENNATQLRAEVSDAADEARRQSARAEQAETALRGAREREASAIAEHAARAERAEAEAGRMRPPVDSLQGQTNGHAGPAWSGRAQRTLAAALAQASEWRVGVRDAVRVIGSEGGWDAVSVWVRDERRPQLKCAAMWLPDGADGKAEFETRTWQRPSSISGSELGHVFCSGETAWLTGIAESDDDRLLSAVEVGMNTALLVPVSVGSASIATLELLSRRAATPDEDVAAAITAVALQLGHFWHLLKVGAEPHWRLGKF